jgi:hypothetical protein
VGSLGTLWADPHKNTWICYWAAPTQACLWGGFPGTIEVCLTPLPSVRLRPVDKILLEGGQMCRALPPPSVRLRPVDKILRGGVHPCTRICDRAMIRAAIHCEWSLRADTSVRVKWQPKPKQYADARGCSQSKSVLLPYQAFGQDQWIISSGGRTDV